MANTKITELSAVTALAGTDVFPVVDVSASTTNKVSVEDLLRNAPDGSAGAPSIANAGDQDTGILFPAANSVGVSTGGTQRLVIDSSGNVGIGTSSPTDNLTIQSSGASKGLTVNYPSGASQITLTANAASQAVLAFGDSSDTDIGKISYDNSSNAFRFFTNTSEKLRIDSSGNVGIGTTHADFKLDVGGPIGLFESNNIVWHDGTGTRAGQLGFTSGEVFTIKSSNSQTERLRIDSSGNVGVGTTSPDQKLHIVGNYKGVNSSGQGVQIVNTATPYIQSLGTSTINDLMVSSKTFRVETGTSYATSERMRIDSSGRLLVGTSSGTDTFQVEGSAGVARVIGNRTDALGPRLSLGKSRGSSAGSTTIVQSGDEIGQIMFKGADGTDVDSTGAAIIGLVDGTPGSNDMPGALTFRTTSDGNNSPTERMRIDSSGNIGVGTTSPGAKLHVNGSTPTLRVSNGTSQVVEIKADTSASILRTTTNHPLLFGTNDTERLRIDSSGNVGISTTSPAGKLSVGPNQDIVFGNQASSGTSGTGRLVATGGAVYLQAGLAATSGSNAPLVVTGYGGVGERLRITSAGNIGVNTSNPQAELHLNDATGLSRIRLSGGASSADNFEFGQGTTGVSNG